jgi:hypothetical protein
MLQVLTTRFDPVPFERLVIFFVLLPVRNLAWFAAVVPAKHSCVERWTQGFGLMRNTLYTDCIMLIICDQF